MSKRMLPVVGAVVLVGVAVCVGIGFWLRQGPGTQGREETRRASAQVSASGGPEDSSADAVAGVASHYAGPLLRFNPKPDQILVYRFFLAGTSSVDLAAFTPAGFGNVPGRKAESLEGLRIHYKGDLNVKFYAAGPDAWNVAAGIFSPRYLVNGHSPAYEDNLAYPFCWRMDSRGRVHSFRFARGTEASAKGLLEELVRMLQVVLPEESALKWQTEEQDLMGDYLASYEISAGLPGTPADLEIRKQKLEYVRSAAEVAGTSQPIQLAMDLNADIRSSRADIVLPLNGSWFFSQVQKQQQALNARGEVVGETEFELKVVRENVLGAVDFPDTFDAFLRKLESPEYLLANLYATEPLLDEMARGLDVLGALDKYAELLGSGDEAQRHLAEPFMVNYLRLRPEAPGLLVAILVADSDSMAEYSQDEQLILWRLVTEAGTPQAQRAVMRAARDQDNGRTARIRAMAYVSDFLYPDQQLVEELWEQYSQPAADSKTTEEQGMVRDMSLLALGVLGNSDKLNEELKPVIGDRIVNALETATTDRERENALGAIGNYGNPAVLNAVIPWFSDANPRVRKAAYTALRRMDSPQAEKVLITEYQRESSEAVRAKALATLAAMSPHPGGNRVGPGRSGCRERSS